MAATDARKHKFVTFDYKDEKYKLGYEWFDRLEINLGSLHYTLEIKHGHG
jgi:hypothetical protein